MFGPAPVLDFDGTIAHLGVDWGALRRQLGVDRIDELWSRAGEWGAVSDAEIKAASTAEAIRAVTEILSTVRCFAVLTSNDAGAVYRFLDRFPTLKCRLTIVVGRTELGGPKTDFPIFEGGVRRCVEATELLRNGAQSVYVGDSEYELDFAHRLGMRVVHVKDLDHYHRPGEG
jgi:phosphoglycolate phosphatase-like HAD superfamily hydrolase